MDDPRQTLMFVGPERSLDRLWDAWTAADETARLAFLHRVRAAYLGGRKELSSDRTVLLSGRSRTMLPRDLTGPIEKPSHDGRV